MYIVPTFSTLEGLSLSGYNICHSLPCFIRAFLKWYPPFITRQEASKVKGTRLKVEVIREKIDEILMECLISSYTSTGKRYATE